MTIQHDSVLTINDGSSSIKFAVYKTGEPLIRGLHGHIDRIGLAAATLTFTDPVSRQRSTCAMDAATHSATVHFLIDWLEKQPGFDAIRAVGHRIVQGMAYIEPQRVTARLVDELRRLRAYDPDHLPP